VSPIPMMMYASTARRSKPLSSQVSVSRMVIKYRKKAVKGLKYSRIDVVGVRDIGGDLSGEIETIGIEVKRGASPFATAAGQTLGYRVYADRVYLADVKETAFSYDEINIASHIGIGLIQIKKKKCIEVLSSPVYKPNVRLNLELLENLTIGKCQLCDSFFNIGKDESSRWSNLWRTNIIPAVKKDKGFMFWNHEVADRKKNLGLTKAKGDGTFERRFICPDCIRYFFTEFVESE